MIPTTDENLAKIREVAEELIGTCKTVDDVLQAKFGDESLTLLDFHADLLTELDFLALECAECGWWCEPSDMHDDHVCEDCA